MRRLLFLLLLPLVCHAQSAVGGIQGIDPVANQIGPNLIGNVDGTFPSFTHWNAQACVTFDSTTTHTADGTGSAKFSACGTKSQALYWRNVNYPQIGTTGRFIIRFWTKTDATANGSIGITLTQLLGGGSGSASPQPGRNTGKNFGGLLNAPIIASSDWVQQAFEFYFDPLVVGNSQIIMYIGTSGQTTGTVWVDDVDIENEWYPLSTFLTCPNYRGYLWSDKACPAPKVQSGTGWPYGTPVVGEITGVGEILPGSGALLSSGTYTVKMATVPSCASGGIGTPQTFSPPLNTQFWHFTPANYGTLTIGTTYYLCSTYTDSSGTYTYPDWAVVYENSTFRAGLPNWVDVDSAMVHGGSRVFWVNTTDKSSGGYMYGSSGGNAFATGAQCNPTQATAKACYELDFQGPCSGTIVNPATTCTGNTVSPLAASTPTTYKGGPSRTADFQALGYNNISTAINLFSSCNPTPGSDQCGPWTDAGVDYGFTSNFITDLYYGSAVSETGTASAPASPGLLSVGGFGSITSNFLFVEVAVVESALPQTQQSGSSNNNPAPLSLPSAPLAINLSTSSCSGVNCFVFFSLPSCPTSRYTGFFVYVATSGTSTPPPNSSFQWQPVSGFPNQLAGGTAIPCGSNVTLLKIINTNVPPPTADGGFGGRPLWVGSSTTDQSSWTTIASSFITHPGIGMMLTGDEPPATSAGTMFRQLQTFYAQGNGIPATFDILNPDDTMRQWRNLADVLADDPINSYGVNANFPENAWATPSGSMACTDFTGVNNTLGPVTCKPAAIDVFAHELGRYTYGSRPCAVAIGEWAHGNTVGQNYADLRRQELKAITGCQDWGIIEAIVGRWVFGSTGSFESSVWNGNTQQFIGDQTWHAQLNGLAPMLLLPVGDSSQIGLLGGTNGFLTSISTSTTASSDCGASSGYANATNFPFGQIRFVTHKDPVTGNVLILVNNLCYGFPTVHIGGNFIGTSVAALGDANTPYTLPISGNLFSDTLGPMEQKVYVVTKSNVAPQAPCQQCFLAENRGMNK